MRNLVFAGCTLLLCAGLAGAQPVTRKEPARYAGPDRSAISAALPPGLRMVLRRPREFALEPLGQAEQAKLMERGILQRTGIHRSVPAEALATGAWETTETGAPVWRMALRSPGSAGIRVEFRNFSVGGGKVWLHDGSEVAGPYTGAGIYGNGWFWSATVPSESVTLEYQPAADASAGDAVPFEVRAISHVAPQSGVDAQTGSTDPADYCHLDPNCYPEWAGAMSMTAQISFEENGSRYVCSGALLATADDSFKPYFLTAGHCIHSEEAARSIEVYWKYQTAACGAEPPQSRSAGGTTLGGHLLASGTLDEGDYSLVLLPEVPSGVVFSGWDLGDPPVGTPVAGIHHPAGSWKRISFGNLIPSQTALVGNEEAPASRFRDVVWSRGRAEPGSSGSPLFTSPGVIAGMLSYGPVSDVLSACQISPSVSGYGKFSAAYEGIKDYVEDLPAAGVAPSETNLNFTILNRAAPGARTVGLSTASTGHVEFKLRADAPWIVLSTASGALSAANPAAVAISADPSQMTAPGQYVSTVTILSGAAAPRFINVTATVKADRSDVTIGITPNPALAVFDTREIQVRLAENAGVSSRITTLKLNTFDFSAYIPAWFGTDRIGAGGALTASLKLGGFPAGWQFLEIRGVDDATGRMWSRTASVDFR